MTIFEGDPAAWTDFQKYAWAEFQRYLSGKGLDLEITNYIAYSIETINYSIGCFLMIAYLVVSKAGKRFHVQLRLLLLLLITGLFGTALSRLPMMPIRLIYARDIPVPWMKTLDGILKYVGFFSIMLVETSTFSIAVERLVAARNVKTYEKKFTSWRWLLCTFTCMITSNAIFDYFIYFFKGDIYAQDKGNPPLITIDTLAEIIMGVSVLGVIFLTVAWKITKRSLAERERGLSQSFQGKENLQVINIILPICIMLFITRTIQLITNILTWNETFGWKVFNAFGIRIMMHLYNQSVAISVFTTAFILIYLQPSIRDSCGRKKSSITDQILVRRQQDVIATRAYFEELKTTWAVA